MERILLIDDDRDLGTLLEQFLSIEGFSLEAVAVPEEGITRALSGDYVFVVLDVMLPGMNGFDVLRRIRGAGGPSAEIPILMLTARRQETDRVVGLELGADDYLAKPFSARELAARVRAILRRTKRATEEAQPALQLTASSTSAAPRSKLVEGDVELDMDAHRVLRDGGLVSLTAIEFELLRLLLSRAGSVVSRADIAEQALGRALMPIDRSVDMHVSNLRKKLGPHSGNGNERIVTVRSVGYIYERNIQGPEPVGQL